MKKNIQLLSEKIELELVGDFQWIKRNDILSLIQPSVFVLDDFLAKKMKIRDNISISVQIVLNKKMQSLNKKFRGKETTTDVLSFPLQTSIRELNYEVSPEGIQLGDIIICSDVCKKQAKEFNISIKEEFVHLFIHGFLHLLGYDHEISKKEDKLMKSLEEKLLKEITKYKKKASLK